MFGPGPEGPKKGPTGGYGGMLTPEQEDEYHHLRLDPDNDVPVASQLRRRQHLLLLLRR
jgi:hypothetical protein